MSVAIAELPSVLHHRTTRPDIAWTRVNAAEALPGLLTPLGWTFWDTRVELALRGAFADMGVLSASEVVVPASVDDRFTALFYGRFTGNLDLLRECADRTPGTSGSALEQQMFGTVRADVPDRHTRRRYPTIAAKLPYVVARIGRRIAANRRDTDAWWRACTNASAPKTEAEARSLLAEAGERFRQVFRAHLVSTFVCQGVFEQLSEIVKAAGRPGLELRLAAGYGGMEEGRILDDLWEVSRERLTLAEFVDDHGYHGYSEGDIARTSWREDPAPLASVIAAYRNRPDSQAPQAQERERAALRRSAEAELLGALDRRDRVRARVVLRLAARHMLMREVGKVSFLQAIDVGRWAAKAQGVLLAERGALTSAQDVCFLTFDELVSSVPSDARSRVADRRALYARYAEIELLQAWVGPPEPVASSALETDDTVELTGLPVYPGVVEGRAVVVADPSIAVLDEGDVLVCEFTDPSWVTLMGLAAALVIDVGGAVSHGAIVARELCIPTVINTGRASRVLRTGDRVRVDAERGTVTKLKFENAVA